MKIAFLSMPLLKHLNPMTALARRLQSRGHDKVFIGVPDVEFFARAADLKFVPFCEQEYPAGSTSRAWGEVAKRHGLDVVLHTTQHLMPVLLKAALEHLPEKLAATVPTKKQNLQLDNNRPLKQNKAVDSRSAL